jgi:hypothetical protein|mmetsp:Transcript_94548/g.147841  ORF Transcript_94548/g.147841 Transcript_94548/m.147841 type:complete len:521 (+) Transcript_94548:61-1623(+)|eukprot:CAMPEP_0169081542 /NCGR_PEP_ID=MMETSP1015-20121227/11068_1 /TAXON_ID=342587 /ORGANISM="Karlodinium micrum, Strain CCMP2283" /LENGTH=520 /DNA_ID=CAMNT_0009141341 /DNA_START=62 /DNA_END=1624 /DNA_ORIENTATION=+
MYTLDKLLQDTSAKRARLASKDGGDSIDYAEVWSSYNRYLVACLEQRRGLQLGNFCKIGWQTEKKAVQGSSKAKSVPYFQLTEQFARSYCPQEVGKLKQPSGDREISPMEEFNFSKAAIKYSQQLTKDQVFTGLRALVQQIGDVVADGQDVDITFGSVGRLQVREREPRFSFSRDLNNLIGGTDSMPNQDSFTEEVRRLPVAPSFSKRAPEEALGLEIGGGAAAEPMQSVPPLGMQPPQDNGYYRDEPPSRRSELRSCASEANMDSMRRTPNLTSQQYKREIAYKEAMDRHISEMEARASEAVREKEAWHQHVNDCLFQERDEIQVKRSRAQQNQYFLRQQVQWREKQKKEQRKDEIIAASAHEFPKFTEPAATEMKEFMAGQAARVRADLDEQVRTNNTLRNLQKRRERSLEVDQLEANRMEMAMLREADRAKKAYDKEALATAWNSEIRMKNIWKAIESHNKVGSHASTHAPQVLSVDQIPPSRAGSTMSSAGRLMTGSSRRVPLGASSSLSKLTGKM